VRQHVEVGVKEGMKEMGRERVRYEEHHTTFAGGRGRAGRRVAAGASIETDVTKCVRACWGRQHGVQRTKGWQRVLIVVQSGEGGAQPNEAAHGDVDYTKNIFTEIFT
jgi:hypothetical protein